MTEGASIEISLTVEFQRKLRVLAKKYCQIPRDIEEILEQLQAGNFPGDRLSGVGYAVFKVRVLDSVTDQHCVNGHLLEI